MKLRADGGRVSDPPPEHGCSALCGAPVSRKWSLCRDCFVLRDKNRKLFRALLKKRGFIRREGHYRPPRRAR